VVGDANRGELRERPSMSARPERAPAFKRDDTVAVFALDEWGFPFFEGWASVDAPCSLPNHYRVRFLSERRSCCRFVNPDWQADPVQSLALLSEFYRAARGCARHEEFFPDIIDKEV